MWRPGGVGDVMLIMRKLKGIAEFKANLCGFDNKYSDHSAVEILIIRSAIPFNDDVSKRRNF